MPRGKNTFQNIFNLHMYVPDLIQGFILLFFTVTEREALEESKAKFVELQKIAVNKREVTEEKKKAYELAEKEALEAQNNVKAAEEKISRQTYSKLLNLLLA